MSSSLAAKINIQPVKSAQSILLSELKTCKDFEKGSKVGALKRESWNPLTNYGIEMKFSEIYIIIIIIWE